MKLFTPEQLQKKYGGISDDKTDNFWPPSYPTKNFGFDKSRLEKVSKDKNSVKGMKNVKNKFQSFNRNTNRAIKEESKDEEEESMDNSNPMNQRRQALIKKKT